MNHWSAVSWNSLWQAAGCHGDGQRWFHELVQRYSEPHRHYHTSQHIAECLELLETVRNYAADPHAIEWAILFHDSVYNPQSHDNEEASARLSNDCLCQAGAPDSFATKTSNLILATKHHTPGVDADTALLIDIDLSIFGRNPQRYLEYEHQIRQEYSWVPQAIYASKRAEILEQFLARDSLYLTPWFMDHFNTVARNNLRQSIQLLKQSAS